MPFSILCRSLPILLLFLSVLVPGMAQNSLPDAAAPVHNRLGQPVAFLPITGPNGRLPHGHLSLTIRTSKPRSYVLKQGTRIIAPISFAPLFTDHSLWSSEENNDHAYQIGRKYFDPQPPP